MIKYNYEDYSKTNNIFQDVFDYNYLDVAREVYNALNVILTKENQKFELTLFKKFQKLQAKYGFACISALSEKELLDLFRNYLDTAFEIIGYNLWDEFKKYLVTLVLYEERDRTKNDIKNILINSELKLTNTNLVFDKKEVSGTVGNWIRDYNSQLGTALVDQVQFEQYFINSQNIKKLDLLEKEKVKIILKFYEKLKISSMTPRGYEERVLMKINGELKVWKDGFLEDIDPTVKKAVLDLKKLGFFKTEERAGGAEEISYSGDEIELAELKKLTSKYSADSLEYKVIEEEIKRREAESRNKE